MMKSQESRRSFLKGLSFVGAGTIGLTRPLLAAGVNPVLTDVIVKMVYQSYPNTKAFPAVVKAFAESLQREGTPQMESPAFIIKAWRSASDELATYVTVQFTLSTNYFALTEGKATQLSLLPLSPNQPK